MAWNPEYMEKLNALMKAWDDEYRTSSRKKLPQEVLLPEVREKQT